MITLLQIEWLKIKKYKPFWLIFAFLIILCPSVTIMVGKILGSSKEATGVASFLGGPFDFNTVFYTSAWINNSLNLAWGTLLILMVGNEFQTKTLRQNVIDGQNRSAIVTSKLLVIFIFSFLSSILVVISGLIAGGIYSSTSFNFSLEIFTIFGISFFAAIMQMLFALVFAFLIKRPAFSVIVYLIYTTFLENIICLIFSSLTKSSFPKLLFTQAADELTIFPLKTIKLDNNATLSTETIWITCLVYAIAILFFLYRYINKTQLK